MISQISASQISPPPEPSSRQRTEHLLPAMATFLATSPLSLSDVPGCRDLLLTLYRREDVTTLQSDAIAEAKLIRARSA